uniref:Uncharacterized protein n=1 Tax=Arundo donax TaxID=35708 RepID=A0A0A9HR44_ARUDO
MGIDASSQIILTSGRAHGVGAEQVLTKISMFARQGMQKIHLPHDTKVIRDICILPGGHAVFASLAWRPTILSFNTIYWLLAGPVQRIILDQLTFMLNSRMAWYWSLMFVKLQHLYIL